MLCAGNAGDLKSKRHHRQGRKLVSRRSACGRRWPGQDFSAAPGPHRAARLPTFVGLPAGRQGPRRSMRGGRRAKTPSSGPGCPLQALKQGRTCPLPSGLQNSDFQPFPSHGTHTLFTKTCSTPRKYIYICQSHTKKIGVTLLHSHQTATIVLAIMILLLDNRREERWVPLTKYQILRVSETLVQASGKALVWGHQ